MKVILKCWNCGNEYDASKEVIDNSSNGKAIKCKCGGYIVKPNGEVQVKIQ